MAGIVSVVFQLDQLASGSNVSSTTSIAASSSNNYAEPDFTIVSGANTINVPSWAVGMCIVPPPTNAVALTLKGVSGDTGVPISAGQETGPITFPAGSPPASVILAAAANVTAGPVVFKFF